MKQNIDCLASAITSNEKTNALLNAGFRLGITEGGLEHKQYRTALAKALRRNLTAGERRRLCYLIGGKAQVSTVSLTANTRNKAMKRVSANMDIRGNKAVKNIV